MKKKLSVYSESVYIFALLQLTLSVAMAAAADFGVSMIAAPAYILSLRTGFSFGQCDYLIEFILLIVFCIVMKKFKILYLSSFVTTILYGAFLDTWRILIPVLNPDEAAPGSMSMPWRIALLAGGMLLTGCSVALLFRVYLYPQAYDLFVKGLSEKTGRSQTVVKRIYDLCSLVLAAAMSLVFFGRFTGIGIGTILMTFLNSFIIDYSGRAVDSLFEFKPLFPKLAGHFNIS